MWAGLSTAAMMGGVIALSGKSQMICESLALVSFVVPEMQFIHNGFPRPGIVENRMQAILARISFNMQVVSQPLPAPLLCLGIV